MEIKTQIEKLKGLSNWSKWKRQVELLLRHSDVLDIVTGDRRMPEIFGEPASSDQRTAYEKQVKCFIKADALAQLILVGSMDDANVELTSTCDSANRTWAKLLSVYEP